MNGELSELLVTTFFIAPLKENDNDIELNSGNVVVERFVA